MTTQPPLSEQTAVITGASSGIGAATARELNRIGVSLVITARDESALTRLASELRNTVVVAADMLDPALPQRLLDTAVHRFGRCDIVFNNAGVLTTGAIADIDVDKVCHMVRINVEAAYRMAYVAVKHFLKAGSGHLVNTSSVMGTKTRPKGGAYAGTKWAIEALSESLRMELAQTNVKVSAIEPGVVQTALHRDWDRSAAETLGIRKPLSPEDVARCIRFQLEQPPHVRIPRLMILPTDHEV
jgi:NADP-dependent 3-hydroxy acid dehydrogenase YdfG